MACINIILVIYQTKGRLWISLEDELDKEKYERDWESFINGFRLQRRNRFSLKQMMK